MKLKLNLGLLALPLVMSSVAMAQEPGLAPAPAVEAVPAPAAQPAVEKAADPVVEAVGAEAFLDTGKSYIANLQRQIDAAKAKLDQAVAEKKSDSEITTLKKSVKKSQEMLATLEKVLEAGAEFVDKNNIPVVGLLLNAGVEGGLYLRVPNTRTYVGPAGQGGTGGLITWSRDERGSFAFPELKGSKLVGANITTKRNYGVLGVAGNSIVQAENVIPTPVRSSLQGFVSVGLIIPHEDAQGNLKVVRRSDLAGLYLGAAMEGGLDFSFIKHFRLNFGVYSLAETDSIAEGFSSEGVFNKATLSEKSSSAWNNVKGGFSSLYESGVKGKATLVLISAMLGSADASVEVQLEGLNLSL